VQAQALFTQLVVSPVPPGGVLQPAVTSLVE
jgi:hypothetical protein